MKLKLLTGLAAGTTAALVIAIGAATPGRDASASLITTTIVPSQELLFKYVPADAGDDTGVRVLTDSSGTISIDLLPGDGGQKLAAPDGFKLLDNTLYVGSSLESGARRIRARIDYGRLGRAGIRARGIRANTLRLLRADIAGGRWIRAVDGISGGGRRTLYRRALRADFKLGYHGFDAQNEFVWAVTDLGKEQYYRIGGLAIVPLPAAWLLFLGGSGLLLLLGRGRARSPA